MSPRTIGRVCGGLIVLMSLASGCSTSSVVDEWREPSAAAAAPYRKVLVVALGKRVEVRRQYEGEFARDLRQRGVEAIEGYALLPDSTDEVDRNALLKAVADSRADAVAITRLLKVEPRVVGGTPTYTPPTTSLHGYHATSWSNYHEPASASGGGGLQPYVQSVATLETSLFDAGSATLVWRATTETLDADAAQRQIPGLVKTLVDAMAKAKMIP
jgi:hypothetical protein